MFPTAVNDSTNEYQLDLSSNQILFFFLGSYKMARIGEVLASDADIGLNSEVSFLLTFYLLLIIDIVS